MTRRPIEILLVEDNPADVLLAREALEMGTVPKNISVVNNGEQAIHFVRKQGRYANAPRPDLILLDLNLPRISGIDVLRHVKADPELRSITVIVLSTSEAASDVNTAYELNANCYVVKPMDYDQFNFTMRGIEDFWMRLASLPSLTPPLSGDARSKEEGASADGRRTPKPGPSTYSRPLHAHRPPWRIARPPAATCDRRRAGSR